MQPLLVAVAGNLVDHGLDFGGFVEAPDGGVLHDGGRVPVHPHVHAPVAATVSAGGGGERGQS
ncbi:hypothetical protein [Nocardiopsis sp. CNT312]|uniref:hypothetical protein n=1 Tax=Nocardiopsis sp. CNT312 TaxID=1137268 RepID=UPI0012DE016F|nr:hypothetical protein [Nocardiopsis sp. CNT312]